MHLFRSKVVNSFHFFFYVCFKLLDVLQVFIFHVSRSIHLESPAEHLKLAVVLVVCCELLFSSCNPNLCILKSSYTMAPVYWSSQIYLSSLTRADLVAYLVAFAWLNYSGYYGKEWILNLYQCFRSQFILKYFPWLLNTIFTWLCCRIYL